jgi:hypothetical protein
MNFVAQGQALVGAEDQVFSVEINDSILFIRPSSHGSECKLLSWVPVSVMWSFTSNYQGSNVIVKSLNSRNHPDPLPGWLNR